MKQSQEQCICHGNNEKERAKSAANHLAVVGGLAAPLAKHPVTSGPILRQTQVRLISLVETVATAVLFSSSDLSLVRKQVKRNSAQNGLLWLGFHACHLEENDAYGERQHGPETT